MTDKIKSPNFSKFVPEIAKNELFKQLSAEGKPVAVRTGLAARALAESTDINSVDRIKLKLIGSIAPFSIAQKELNQLRNSNTRDPSLKKKLLLEVIHFNHLVKDLVDHEQTLSFNSVLTELTSEYTRMLLPDSNPKWFMQETEAALNGMRHELAYERILGELYSSGVEYDQTTLTDEIKGVDYFVEINGIRTGIDVKASQSARDKAQDSSYHPERIVWSQFSWEDFTDGFHVSQDLARQRSQAALEDLTYATSYSANIA